MSKDNKISFQMQLNSIPEEQSNPTELRTTWIVHDFEPNLNNVLVTKEVALENAKTLLNKPVVTKYFPVAYPNTMSDALGTHAQVKGENRYGEEVVELTTTPIGTIVTEGYIMTIEVNGEDKEVLAVDAVLWKSRFPDACDLIMEWYNRGISVGSSCEYLYSNFTKQDGITQVHSPLYYEGHCILNSEKRGTHNVVTPSYTVSKMISLNELQKFERLVAQALNQKEEEDNMAKEGNEMFRKVCELSHSDIRSLIYMSLKALMSEEEYDGCYIYDVYDNHVVIEMYEDSTFKCYDLTYSNENDVVTVDMSTKTEVMRKREWVAVDTVTNLEQSLNQANEKVEELTTELNQAKEDGDKLSQEFNESKATLETVQGEKQELNTKYTEATEKLTSLNSVVEDLQGYKEKYNQEQFEKSLNEKTEYYETKFRAVNGLDKFKGEDVQNLIKLSINESEDGTNAKMSLNSMLVDMVELKAQDNVGQPIREMNSTIENLVDVKTDFDSRYK